MGGTDARVSLGSCVLVRHCVTRPGRAEPARWRLTCTDRHAAASRDTARALPDWSLINSLGTSAPGRSTRVEHVVSNIVYDFFNSKSRTRFSPSRDDAAEQLHGDDLFPWRDQR